MSDESLAIIQRIPYHSNRINSVADNATKMIADVEALLNGCGVEAWAGIGQQTQLGYQRHNGKFRIVVSCGPSVNDPTFPWAEADRSLKLEAIQQLPELLKTITEGVEQQLQQSEKAELAVKEALEIMYTSKPIVAHEEVQGSQCLTHDQIATQSIKPKKTRGGQS